MGCHVVMEESDFCLCVHPATRLPINFKDHDGTVTGSFHETQVGLDHLALAVADRDELERWSDWLARHDVSLSEITETDLGHHLNLRAPDDIAIELFVSSSKTSQPPSDCLKPVQARKIRSSADECVPAGADRRAGCVVTDSAGWRPWPNGSRVGRRCTAADAGWISVAGSQNRLAARSEPGSRRGRRLSS